MALLDELLDGNRRYAEAFDRGDLRSPPARGLAVLTCMDARLEPLAFLGLDLGDAHVIRNAGGRASDEAIRSLIISSHLLGTREYVVVHHTDCGMLTFSNEELRERLREATGADPSGIDFLPFSDLDESVREDVRRIQASPFIPADVAVSGLVHDVRTGMVRRVVGPTQVRAA